MNKEEVSEHKSKKKKSRIGKIAKNTIKAMVIVTIAFLGIILYFRYGKDIVRMHQEAEYYVAISNEDTFSQSQTTEIYDTNNKLITTLNGEKDVYYVEYDAIPKYFEKAMISVEDRKFYKHHGVDIKGIGRAFVALLKHDGKITQGASTITQQLSRNIFLTNEVTWERKVEEVFIATDMEKKYSKEDIMEFYLNNIYFGNGYYGIGAASKGYFNTNIDKLSLSQIAFLCAIPNNPSLYDPVDNMDNTISRRNKILKDMLNEGYINELDYQLATEEEIVLNIAEDNKIYDYVETYIYHSAIKSLMKEEGFVFQYKFESEELEKKYDEEYRGTYNLCQQKLFVGGYRIYTSIDMEKQSELQNTIDEELMIDTSVNEEGIYKLQGAATCIDNNTGRVVAIVGGRSQELEGYSLNRAYQSPRQPGSAIKPLIVYLPSIEKGYRPFTIVNDSPIENGPKNAGGYEGDITLEKAVYKSKNVVAYRLYGEITPMVGVQYLLDMHFSKLTIQDRENMATCLGGFEYGVTSVEMASAYATIYNDGMYREPTCIKYIENAKGNVIVKDNIEEIKIYDQNASRMMTDILTKVLQDGGTAAGFGIKGMNSAGKTGTTNSNKDGWFCGYTPYYTTTVWIGYDIPEKLDGLRGNTYPVKIWNRFMTIIHEGLNNIAFHEYYLENPSTDDIEITEQVNEEDTENIETTTEQALETTTEVTTEANTEAITEQSPETETETTTESNDENIQDIE